MAAQLDAAAGEKPLSGDATTAEESKSSSEDSETESLEYSSLPRKRLAEARL